MYRNIVEPPITFVFPLCLMCNSLLYNPLKTLNLTLSQTQDDAFFHPWQNIFERCACVCFLSLKYEVFGKETEAFCLGILLDIRRI